MLKILNDTLRYYLNKIFFTFFSGICYWIEQQYLSLCQKQEHTLDDDDDDNDRNDHNNVDYDDKNRNDDSSNTENDDNCNENYGIYENDYMVD